MQIGSCLLAGCLVACTTGNAGSNATRDIAFAGQGGNVAIVAVPVTSSGTGAAAPAGGGQGGQSAPGGQSGQSAGAGQGGQSGQSAGAGQGGGSPQAMEPTLKHRGYLGWVGDLRRAALTGAVWPDISLDQTLLDDYHDTLQALVKNGQNEVTLWGLFTNDNWAVEVEKTIDPSRTALVQQMLQDAHQSGLKVLVGMGVYSWGFAKIIQAHPEVACASNGNVMSLSSTAAWDFQRRVIDYTLDQFAFDGISLQSADRGRCRDGDLAALTDQQYHAQLNRKVAEYVKGKRASALVGISGWGMDFGVGAALDDYKSMAEFVDYIVDVDDTALAPGRAYRKSLITAIAPTSFGSIGSPNVEPIQHYPRDRYFVPTLLKPGQQMADLFADGGQAVETYARTRGNPGDRVSMEFLGRLESAGFDDLEGVLRQVLSEIYEPQTPAALAELAKIFEDAETAFFDQAGNPRIILLAPRNAAALDLQQTTFASWSNQAKVTYHSDLASLEARVMAIAPQLKAEPAAELLKALGNAKADMATLAGI